MELWHEVAGEGSPVFLIHAGIFDSRMWEPQWRTFPPVHRTVRCDLRGYGRTPLPKETYSHAGDVAELLDQLRLARAALVGNSMGGAIALEVALARPDLVDRLVLVGSGLPGHEWSEQSRRFDEEEEAALARGDLEAAIEVGLRLWVDGPGRRHQEVEPGGTQPGGGDDARFVCGAGAAGILLIADRLVQRIPGAREVVIPGTAHLPSLERPLEFDREVLPFLSAR
jgi:pimeloyl-ACP methyl ester carboxylesterase